jgi:Flp pilus assembly protein TadD
MKKINLNVKQCGAIFLFLLCLSCFFTSVKAQGFSNTITGFVFDSQRRPVTQIPVEVMNEVYQVLQRTKTDGSGRFFFSGLSAGRFSVRVMPFGTNFEEQTQEVEIINFVRPGSSTSENAQKDFYLRVRRNAGDASTVNSTVFAQEVPEEARKLYEKGISALDEKRVDEGILQLQDALKILPAYYLALERLGIEYVKQQKYQNAQETLSKAVAVNDRIFNGWYGLSYANYGLRQPKAAVEAAQKAVSINSNSTDATLLLGISLRQAQRYEEAEKSLKQANKISKGSSADVYWNLALLYAHNFKRYKAAADSLELYLKVQPNAPNAGNIRKLIKQFREKPEGN